MSDGDPDLEGRSVLGGWLSARVEKDRQNAPSTLWHYTDAGGLKGIITDGQMWFTNARFLNDSMELSHGIERARNALERYPKAGLSGMSKRFLEGLIDPARNVLGGYLNRTAEIFVVCFCPSGDLLSQWRAYSHASVAGGYSIGFAPPGDIFAWPQSASGGHQLMLRRVLYDPVEQDRELQDLVAGLVPVLDANPGDPRRQNSFGRHFVDGVVEAASWYKHPAFAEEQEWRVVYVRSNDPNQAPLLHRASNGLIIPYVSLRLPRSVGVNPDELPITRVNCGPSPEPSVKMRGVRSLLDSSDAYSDVSVEGSSTPLRW